MFKKFLILMILVLFSSSLIYGTNCYSSATVKNSASVKIVDSKDALIAIPSSFKLEDNITIKNNTSEKIKVWIYNGKIGNKVEVPLEAGQSITDKIYFNNNQNQSNVTFHAEGYVDNFKAQITSSINQ